MNAATSCFYSGRYGKTSFATVLAELYNMMMKRLTELDCKPKWPLIL